MTGCAAPRHQDQAEGRLPPWPNMRQLRLAVLPLGDRGQFTPTLMLAPFCPHDGCGWSMPELWCPDHGNFGMTFLFATQGAITHVKAVLS